MNQKAGSEMARQIDGVSDVEVPFAGAALPLASIQMRGETEMAGRSGVLVRRATLRLCFVALWLGLTCWRLTSVPGMAMDEGWSITSARGLWPPENPFSGMTAYAGPFPVLLLQLFGPDHGLVVLRGASVVANTAMLIAIWQLLRRFSPARAVPFWGLPLIASSPVWLASLRTGIEVTMFTPALAVCGLYAFTLRTRWSSFAGGIAWGLLVYNHLLGAFFIPAAAFAWLLCYWRLPPIAWGPALGGFALGIAPRLLAVWLYWGRPLEGSAGAYAFWTAVHDLRWLPKGLWETLLGETVYLRYVGHLAVGVRRYWALAPLLFVPWLWRLPSVPRYVWFTLVTALSFSMLATVGAPYMAVRFFVIPVVGLAVCTVFLAAATIGDRDQWAYLAHAVGIALLGATLFYDLANFYNPWRKNELAVSAFFLGERSANTGSWAFLPKEELVQALNELDPKPEQVFAPASLQRQLEAILHHTSMRAVDTDAGDPELRTVYVQFVGGDSPDRVCFPVSGEKMCFQNAGTIARYYTLYR
jgi:hypothetical protein